MMKHLLVYIFSFFIYTHSYSQCEGCIINPNCSSSPAEPSLCPEVLPDGTSNTYYEIDLTFFMPQQFAVEGVGNVTLSRITINSVSGLPQGLLWSANEPSLIYNISSDPNTQRGCVRICGEPQVIGAFTVSVNVTAEISSPINTSTEQSFTLPLQIFPGGGGNPGFSFSPSSGCDSITVNFTPTITNDNPPTLHTWDFGNGTVFNGSTPPSQNYTEPGIYEVSLLTEIQQYIITALTFTATTNAWCGDVEEPNIFGCIGSPDIYFIVGNEGTTTTSATIDDNTTAQFTNLSIPLTSNSFTLEFFDEDLISQNDPLGTTTINFNNIGTINFSTSEGIGFVTIATQVGLSFTVNDTIQVFDSPETPEISALISADPLCSGDSIILTSTSANFYQWFTNGEIVNNANNSEFIVYTTGLYAVEVADANGCRTLSDDVSFFIGQIPETPQIFFNPITGNLICNPGSQLTWSWFLNGEEIENSQNLAEFDPLESGSYSVIVVNNDGCSAVSDGFDIDTTPVFDIANQANWTIYPNPANGNKLYVRLGNNLPPLQIVVSLRDLSGRIIFESNSFNSNEELSVLISENVSNGIYLIDVRSHDGLYVWPNKRWILNR